MGITPLLIKDGVICKVGTLRYNAAPVKSIGVGTPSNSYCGAGNYQGRGDYELYSQSNGQTYGGGTFASPTLGF